MLIATIILILAYALAKAMADITRMPISLLPDDYPIKSYTAKLYDYWHTISTLAYWSLGAAWVLIAVDHTATVLLRFPTGELNIYSLIGNIGIKCFAAYLFGQPFFEGLYSLFRRGSFYGKWCRSLPVEIIPKSWMIGRYVPVMWNQIRIEGWKAPVWDICRLIIAVWLFVKF